METPRGTPVPLYQLVLIGLAAGALAWVISGRVVAAVAAFVFTAGGRLAIAYWKAVSDDAP